MSFANLSSCFNVGRSPLSQPSSLGARWRAVASSQPARSTAHWRRSGATSTLVTTLITTSKTPGRRHIHLNPRCCGRDIRQLSSLAPRVRPASFSRHSLRPLLRSGRRHPSKCRGGFRRGARRVIHAPVDKSGDRCSLAMRTFRLGVPPCRADVVDISERFLHEPVGKRCRLRHPFTIPRARLPQRVRNSTGEKSRGLLSGEDHCQGAANAFVCRKPSLGAVAHGVLRQVNGCLSQRARVRLPQTAWCRVGARRVAANERGRMRRAGERGVSRWRRRS